MLRAASRSTLYRVVAPGIQWNSSEVFVALDGVGLYWTILDGTPWNLSEVSVILDRSLILDRRRAVDGQRDDRTGSSDCFVTNS